MASPEIDEAIRLADRGDKDGAQKLLAQYLQSNPKDEYAWQWLAYILPDRAQKVQALQQCLKFIPNSQSAHDDLDSLRLGAPLARPISPPPYPSTSSQSFLERDVFLPDEDKTFIAQTAEQAFTEDDQPLEDITVFSSSPALKQPKPRSEDATLISQRAFGVPAKASPRPSAKAASRKPVRRKKSAFKGWQLGCLGILALFLLVLLLGAGWAGYNMYLGRDPFGSALVSLGLLQPTSTATPGATPVVESDPNLGTVVVLRPGGEIVVKPTATLPPTPAPTATPTLIPLPVINLPADLYFISNAGGSPQIWRQSADGKDLVQVTSEKHPVTEFDVSPLDSQLAYITNNQLMLANADGSKRRTLVYGYPLPPEGDPTYWKTLIANPVWSPDGLLLAYAQDGVQVIDPVTTIAKRIEPNVFLPEDPAKTRLYFPLSWSPEGERITVFVQRVPCSTMGIVFMSGFSRIDNIPVLNGQFAWAPNGLSLYLANPFSDCKCETGSGLWKVDPATGNITNLRSGMVRNQTPAAFVGWPKPMADGTLLYFYGEEEGPACSDDWPSATPLTMVLATNDRDLNPVVLREDAYLIGETLWAADGSLAVIRDLSLDDQALFGPLVVLDGNGSPAVALAIPGRNMRWGTPAP